MKIQLEEGVEEGTDGVGDWMDKVRKEEKVEEGKRGEGERLL